MLPLAGFALLQGPSLNDVSLGEGENVPDDHSVGIGDIRVTRRRTRRRTPIKHLYTEDECSSIDGTYHLTWDERNERLHCRCHKCDGRGSTFAAPSRLVSDRPPEDLRSPITPKGKEFIHRIGEFGAGTPPTTRRSSGMGATTIDTQAYVPRATS